MYLLNSDSIVEAVEHGQKTHRLYIYPFIREECQHTFYYFHLGEKYRPGGANAPTMRLDPDNPVLTLEPNRFLRVWTQEKFQLDHRTLGVIGPSTDLVDRGVAMLHSPFIDPMFPHPDTGAALRIGLHNVSSEEVNLSVGDRIGKVSFFDVSDTYPVRFDDGSSVALKFEQRRAENA